MSREPICCDADQTTDKVLKIMVEYGVRRLPVRNRTCRVIGLISRSDIGFPLSDRKPYQINFYKNVQAGSISRPVLMDTVYVSGCPNADAALEMACQRIVDAHGVAAWDQFADRYELFYLGETTDSGEQGLCCIEAVGCGARRAGVQGAPFPVPVR